MANEMLEQLKKDKLIAIMRAIENEKVLPAAKALAAGGIHFIEVTFSQASPTCVEDTTRAIRLIAESIPEIHVGAGTVISVEQVEAAYNAGAKYIISPNTDRDVIRRTVELGMLSFPGAFSPSEIADAWKAGATIVKVFPAGDLGAGYVKAVRAPLSHIPMMAVGGVGLNNMEEFYKAGYCGFGIGGSLVKKDLIEAGDWAGLEAHARKYTELVAGF